MVLRISIFSYLNRLWDHLASNLELYAQPQESYPDEGAKSKPALGNQGRRSDPQLLHSESDREKSGKLSRSRHNKEWKGLVRDAAELPPLRSSEIDDMHAEDNNRHRVSRSKRAFSPRRPIERKRNRPDERQQAKVCSFFLN